MVLHVSAWQGGDGENKRGKKQFQVTILCSQDKSPFSGFDIRPTELK